MICPECKGTGWIELFTSRERCGRCTSADIWRRTIGGIIIGPEGDYADVVLWEADTNTDLVGAGECAGATVVD